MQAKSLPQESPEKNRYAFRLRLNDFQEKQIINMAKLLSSLIALPITNVASTIRALLQNSSGKNWLFTGEPDWPGSPLSALAGGNDMHIFALDPAEDFTSEGDWTDITITVDGTEKIKLEHGAVNLAPLYKTAETVYFKHIGEFLDGLAKGKFPSLAGAVGVVLDQTTPRLWVVPSGEVAVSDGSPVLSASIEIDQPSNDFGE